MKIWFFFVGDAAEPLVAKLREGGFGRTGNAWELSDCTSMCSEMQIIIHELLCSSAGGRGNGFSIADGIF